MRPNGHAWLMCAGKTPKEEPLLLPHEQRAPQDRPRSGRGLRRGERELRQRAQAQRGHHRSEVRFFFFPSLIYCVMKSQLQMSDVLSRGKSACPNSTLTSLIERETAFRAPPPIAHTKQHSSKSVGLIRTSIHYTTVCHNRQRPLTDALISSVLLQGHQWNLLVQDGERGARRRLF